MMLMSADLKLKIGCCGWSYLRPEKNWREKFKSKLQVYASLFDIVEVNSTFYKLPRLATCETWFQEAREVNPNFEFVVKAPKAITHEDRFSSQASIEKFEEIKKICKSLKAEKLLFQTPASFKPSATNISAVKNFFHSIKRENLQLIWEVRGKEWKPEIIRGLFSELDIEHCSDPFATKPIARKFAYLRLHGSPPGNRMYYYKYSRKDFEFLKNFVEEMSKNVKEIYIMFNNIYMYEDSIEFMKYLNEKI